MMRDVQNQSRYLTLIFAITVLSGLLVSPANAQREIPDDYRGSQSWVARGILDGNLIETNFRNHGELSRWDDLPWGVWPRGVGGRHIDGIGIMVAGRVPAERVKWNLANADTLVNPVILTYRDAGKRLSPSGLVWGWQPLRDFHNPDRTNRLGQLEPTPALSDDPSSWPGIWPDRLSNSDDPGWAGSWNGFFGKGVFNADLESFYVMDDFSDLEYHIDRTTGLPNSEYGVFYPSPSDSTMGGMGLQAQVRIFQWANVLAEDVMFIIYRIANKSETEYRYNLAGDEGLFFAQVMDYGLGNEEGDENAAFNALEDITFGWDQDGIGQRTDGTLYDLGYTGFAFLESPVRDEDGLDNDEDGMVDELRFGGPGERIEGQDAILLTASGRLNITDFERAAGPISEQPAYLAGVWWTGDENLDWVGFEDLNDSGVWEPGEPVNNDVGADGLGPYDFGYPGPDLGEADGMPTAGEPNFDELDVAESDQIGLTGFDLNSRPFYESGDNLRNDTWLFDRILNNAQFPLGTPADAFAADVEPFIVFVSGPINLNPDEADFFSTAWIFGADEQDFFKNRRTVQNIYDADYNFAQAPIQPTLTASAGDGRVTLSWDTTAVASFDRFSQQFDFEGFRLYKGTDPLLSDARLISDLNGTPTFYRPMEQWDLDNGIRGPISVLDGEAVYNLGNDTGLSYYYVDEDVTNGITYYYAIVAYDHGVLDSTGTTIVRDPVSGFPEVDPQENVFNVSVNLSGEVVGLSRNAAIVVPRTLPAGYVGGGANEDLSRVSSGLGTGSISVRIIDDNAIRPDTVYTVSFDSQQIDLATTDHYQTTSYSVTNKATGETIIDGAPLTDVSPLVDGFVIEFANDVMDPFQVLYDSLATGFRAQAGTANEEYVLDLGTVDGLGNWKARVHIDSSAAFTPALWSYELTFVNPNDSTYKPPRFGIEFTRADLPIFGRNATLGTQTELYLVDKDESKTFTIGDQIVISEVEGRRKEFRHRVTFYVDEGETPEAPPAGTVFQIAPRRPFYEGDVFQFTVGKSRIDEELAASQLDQIAVVPNPYVAASAFEPASQISGRGERRLQFIHLPQSCTIRIYNIRGELIQTLYHEGVGSDGAMFWDMLTRDQQDLAYGVYIYHVEAPGIGEHIGKFAVVK